MLKRRFKLYRREAPSPDTLSGYAFRFTETINYLGRKERFSPNLKVDYHKGGTYLLRDHNTGKLLAKHPDTLSFEIDKEGLSFIAKKLNTPLWEETNILVREGVLNGASVGFAPIKHTKDKDVVVFDQIELFELSLVAWPAYQSSEVNARTYNFPSRQPRPWELIK